MQKLPTPGPLLARFCLFHALWAAQARLLPAQERPVLFFGRADLLACPFLAVLLPCGGRPLFCALVHIVVNPELSSCPSLPELVVVVHHAFCVDHHPPGHHPGTWSNSKVKPHLCFVSGKLVSLNRLSQVRLPYRAFHQDKELTLRLLCTPFER